MVPKFKRRQFKKGNKANLAITFLAEPLPFRPNIPFPYSTECGEIAKIRLPNFLFRKATTAFDGGGSRFQLPP